MAIMTIPVMMSMGGLRASQSQKRLRRDLIPHSLVNAGWNKKGG